MKKLLICFFCLGIAACASGNKKTKAKKDEKSKVTKEAKASVSSVRYTECKSNSDIRKIEVKESNGTFEVLYTKFGETKSIANGSREHSESIRDRVKNNLENAGFQCS